MRCALDHQRLGPGDTAEQGGYLVHVTNGRAVLPLHEVIEGRLLRGGTGDESVSGPVEQPTMPIAERRVDEP